MLLADLVIVGVSGQRVNLPTHRAYGIVVNNTKRGFGSLQFKMRLTLAQIILFYGNPQVLNVYFKRGTLIFDGRLEDVAIDDHIVTFTALGYYRALGDVKYTALWSDASVKSWFTVNVQYHATSFANRTPEKYSVNFDNRIYIGLVKGNIYTNGADVCSIAYRIPSGSNRNLLGIFISLEILLPANWHFRILSFDSGFTAASVAVVYGPLVATGALQRLDMALYFPLQSNASLVLEIYNNTGANYNMAGETGTYYAKATEIRVVTTDNLRWVNTSFTAARAAGVNVTATVGSTAGMYVGQRIVITSGFVGICETVTVLSIINATQFNATFVNNHGIGEQVSQVTVYPDQIVGDMLNTARTANSTQLSASTAGILSNSFDLLNEVYTDENPIDIIDYLCNIGDGTQQYEAGVLGNKQLYFRPRNDTARQWYIDYNDPQIKTSIDKLFNSIYVIYQDLLRNDLRSSAVVDADSIRRYGITRQLPITITTTNATLATKKRDLTLIDTKTIIPQATIVVPRLLANPNVVARLVDLMPGDYVTITNLPGVITGTALDRLRTFRVVETKLDYDNQLLTIVPELTLPTVDYQLANLLMLANRLPTEKTGTGKNLDRRQT